ncbi:MULTISPECIES: hypothetical protein [unclassified Variovorax]|uniref:hypothetical protein n=1 Tax=unclassified Variovorax TaxID=663243 RepID=UPI001BD4D292|nr:MULTISPECIES: hypothetical protein [unclassified Variovorax]
MHSAPSVSYPMGRSRIAARLLVAIWAAGACCAGWVCWQVGAQGWRGPVLAFSVLLAALGARALLERQRPGELRFDGRGWQMTGAANLRAARLTPALDFQSLMLVRIWAPKQRSRWQWLERGSAPERWLALRRAVYSRASPAEPDGPAAAPQPSAPQGASQDSP